MKVGLHLASLYYLYDNYEEHLDERIAAGLAYGCEHLELSNGPSIMHWRPAVHIPVTFSVHAEVYRTLDITPAAIIAHIASWSQLPEYIVFHPNELLTDDYAILAASPIPCLLENMDSKKPVGKTVQELLAWYTQYGLRTCLDIAHIESNGLQLIDFMTLPIAAVHVSRSIDNTHWLLASTGMVILPEAPVYIIEGIVYTWQDLATEIALLKSACARFSELRQKYPQHHIVSGIDDLLIEGWRL